MGKYLNGPHLPVTTNQFGIFDWYHPAYYVTRVYSSRVARTKSSWILPMLMWWFCVTVLVTQEYNHEASPLSLSLTVRPLGTRKLQTQRRHPLFSQLLVCLGELLHQSLQGLHCMTDLVTVNNSNKIATRLVYDTLGAQMVWTTGLRGRRCLDINLHRPSSSFIVEAVHAVRIAPRVRICLSGRRDSTLVRRGARRPHIPGPVRESNHKRTPPVSN